MAVLPPKAQATRSNSNKPTRPQFKQPIMLKIRQILSNITFNSFVMLGYSKNHKLCKKRGGFFPPLKFIQNL